MRSNCLFHAVGKWIRRGGWLLVRRSHAGWYPHFIHAAELPEDLPCSQYVAKPGVPCSVVFDGEVKEVVGDVKPPPVIGFVDGVVLGFCISITLGWLCLIAFIIGKFV
jgi:hypothetical protein